MSDLLLILTLYQDYDAAHKMLDTLEGCRLPVETGLYIADATEEPSSVSHGIISKLSPHVNVYVPERRMSLMEALNRGIEYAHQEKYRYVAWIHPDMDFSADRDWVLSCILALECEHMVGKVSPTEFKTDHDARKYLEAHGDGRGNAAPVKGNACPWVMRVSDLMQIKEHYGEVFCTQYEIMAYEDWDLINRLMMVLGKSSVILPYTVAVHEGMGTRERHDYGDSFAKNKQLYREKWGWDDRHL